MVNSVHTKRYQILKHLLIEARKAKGLSQAELADVLGRVQTFVSKYERGERRLDIIEFIDVTSALDIAAVKVFRKILAADEV